jgi:putative membrane protein
MPRSHLLLASLAAAALTIAAAAPRTLRPTPHATSPAAARLAPAPLTDANIAAIFDAANTFDIETGHSAAAKGSSAEVRAFGAQLEHDHTAVRQQGRDLLKKLGVTPGLPDGSELVAGLVKGHKDIMAALDKTPKGAAYDRAFLQHEVDYHKAVIDAVTTTLLPAIQNAELKALVVKVAPAFQAHMVAAQNLLATVK